ncbi:hypothetical protein HZ326_29338 [Fusarium oxysporum f. sp. albedinis]|nr:hypothetical protein HZ326_29338 [Fusarium oxysporum f. sp. albedinis]
MQRHVLYSLREKTTANREKNEWMAKCFLNNVYCCYLPAHCSHRLQPLDNGVFNACKAAYRRELAKFACLTDSAPIDKVNFIRAYAKARSLEIDPSHDLKHCGTRRSKRIDQKTARGGRRNGRHILGRMIRRKPAARFAIWG